MHKATNIYFLLIKKKKNEMAQGRVPSPISIFYSRVRRALPGKYKLLNFLVY